MSKHTPGPWQIAPASDDAEVLQIVAGYRALPNGTEQASWIAECDLQEDPGENAANARLIAAAPEMLAVLLQLRDDWFEPHYGQNDIGYAVLLRDAIRAVIAKAEGK